jgi:hypothetical protein
MPKNSVERLPRIGRMPGMIRLETTHKFLSPREAVWSCLSKTDWLNRALGLPSVAYHTEARPEGGSWMTAEAKVPWGRLRWRELPFEWVEPRFYSVRRLFASGPFIEARMGIDFQVETDGGTRVISFSELQPRNAFGNWLGRGVVGRRLSAQMAGILEHAACFLRGQAKLPFRACPFIRRLKRPCARPSGSWNEADNPPPWLAAWKPSCAKRPMSKSRTCALWPSRAPGMRTRGPS